MENNIFTYYLNLPATIKSFVVSNNDMSFTIVINSRIGYEQQLMAYIHEMDHIINGDFDHNISADLLELAAHGV